jgi:hypothetical protein
MKGGGKTTNKSCFACMTDNAREGYVSDTHEDSATAACAVLALLHACNSEAKAFVGLLQLNLLHFHTCAGGKVLQKLRCGRQSTARGERHQ